MRDYSKTRLILMVEDLRKLIDQKNDIIKELEDELYWSKEDAQRDGGGYTNQEIIENYENMY